MLGQFIPLAPPFGAPLWPGDRTEEAVGGGGVCSFVWLGFFVIMIGFPVIDAFVGDRRRFILDLINISGRPWF